MLEGEALRQILIADLALLRGVAKSRDVAAALQRFWDERESGASIAGELIRIAHLDAADLEVVQREADRLIAEANDDVHIALTQRGGLDQSIHSALSSSASSLSRALRDSGVGSRPELPTLRADRYVDFQLAGRGGMGLVYLAVDTELNRDVAFKIIRPDAGESESGDSPRAPVDAEPPARDTPASQVFEELRSRFLQEATVTGGLEHPGIVPVYELGQTEKGVPYYTMRFVRGNRTLVDAIDEVRSRPAEARLALLEPFLKLCDTVGYAHARGVVHRDLKPENAALGEFGEVVLLDWGLARLGDHEEAGESRLREWVESFRREANLETQAGPLGTPGYMAPEVALGRLSDVDGRSDVYSLGAILFEILTGRLPHQFRTRYEFLEVIQRPAQSVRDVDPEVPPALGDLCTRALAIQPIDRLASVAELTKGIRDWQTATVVEREIGALLQEARDALAAAEAMKGEALLRQVDRAKAALSRAALRREDHPQLEPLDRRAHELRERGIRERERHARRRTLRRAAAVVLGVGLVVAFWVIQRFHHQRQAAERLAERESLARGQGEALVQFLLDDLQRRLEVVGQGALAESVVLRCMEYCNRIAPEAVTSETLRTRAGVLASLGDVRQGQERHDEALAHHREALAIFERLSASAPRDSSLVLARAATHRRIADDLGNLEEPAASLGEYGRTVALARSTAEREPANHLAHRLWARGLVSLAWADFHAGRGAEATARIRRAIRLMRDLLAAGDPSRRLREELRVALGATGQILQDLGKPELARARLMEVVQIATELSSSDPEHVPWQVSVAHAHDALAEALELGGRYEEALGHQQEAIQAYTALSHREPLEPRHQGDLAHSLSSSATIHERLGQSELATRAYVKASDVAARLTAWQPREIEWLDLAFGIRHSEALLRSELGANDGALAGLQACETCAIKACDLEESDEEWFARLWKTRLALGTLLVEMERPGQAEESFRRALQVADGRPRASPHARTWAWRRSEVQRLLAEALFQRGQHEEALDLALRAGKLTASHEDPDADDVEAHRVLMELHVFLEQFHREGRRLEAALEHATLALEHGRTLASHESLWLPLVPDLGRLRLGLVIRTEGREPRTPEEHLALAFHYEAERDLMTAVRHYEVALDGFGHGDLDPLDWYAAACVAARASILQANRVMPHLQQLALRWIAVYVDRRKEALREMERRSRDPALDRDALGSLHAEMTTIVADLRSSYRGDPELESLRERDEFHALFQSVLEGR